MTKTRPQHHEWQAAHKQFIIDNAYGISTFALTEKLNRHFGLNLLHSQVLAMAKRLKARNGLLGQFTEGHKAVPFKSRYFVTEEQKQFLQDNIENNNYDLAEMFNAKFDTQMTARRIYGIKVRHDIYGAKRGSDAQRFTNGGFKKGNVPPLFRPVGSRLVHNSNYAWIKTPNGIKQEQIVVWEKAHGKIPEGYVLLHLDRNPNNNALENLKLVSQNELARLNQNRLLVDDAQLNESACLVAKLICETHKAAKKANGEGST